MKASLPATERDIAERRERIARGEYREWQLPEPEPPPRTRPTAKRPAITSNERNEIFAIVGAMIRHEVSQALKAREAAMADAIGKAIAAERIKFRELHAGLAARVEKLAPDNEATTVFDLRDLRRRRSGNAA